MSALGITMKRKIIKVGGNHARLLMELGFTVGEEVTIIPHGRREDCKLTHFQIRGADYVLGPESTNSIVLRKLK